MVNQSTEFTVFVNARWLFPAETSQSAEASLGADPVTAKKKSKVVTTSGAHPGGAQNRNRSFAPKKRATTALLDKTIASCKALLMDSINVSYK